MDNIQAEDTVRHTTRPLLSGGAPFNVLKVEGTLAYCDFFNENGVNKQAWFPLADLILVQKAKINTING